MNKVLVVLFLFNVLILPVFSQSIIDSLPKPAKDSVLPDSSVVVRISLQKAILLKNKLLDLTSAPVQFITAGKKPAGKEALFYLLATVTLLLGFLKVFYSKYFNNIFQVFFNTSMRQNQLTELLLQAKLSSLIFNIYFFITGGIYSYFLLELYGLVTKETMFLTIGGAAAVMGAIYLVKYCCLLFLGWLADMSEAAHTYIFITFLVNKILGICILPFVIFIAFSRPDFAGAAVIISLMVIGLLYISRFLRSYGLLQKDLRISVIHFFIYILAIEVIPLIVIYKAVLLTFHRASMPV